MKYFFIFIKITILAIALSNLSACFGYFSDQAHSERLFEQYCHEEGRVGQFIYERVALGEEFFRAIPTDEKELRQIDSSYYFYSNGKKLLIDKERFKQRYAVNYWERKVLSPVGPIYTMESTIVRKEDSKVLSKAVSLLNMLDKSSKYFHVEGVTCPTGRDSKGHSFSNKHHFNLIENTFFVQN